LELENNRQGQITFSYNKCILDIEIDGSLNTEMMIFRN